MTWTLNLWGPILNMTNAASAQALEEGKKRLRDFLESSETGRQAIGMNARPDESYEMKRMNETRSAKKPQQEEDVDDI